MDDGPGMRHLPNFGLPDVFPTVDAWESIRRPTRHSDEALTGTPKFDTLEPLGAFDLKPDNHLALL